MYLYYKNDCNAFIFNFKANTKYTIQSVDEQSYGFSYPNGSLTTITKAFLKTLSNDVV